MTVWLIAEGVVVAVAAWLGWRTVCGIHNGIIATWLGWCVMGIFFVVTAGLFASATGYFGAAAFTSVHVLMLGVMVAVRFRAWRTDWAAVCLLVSGTRARLRGDPVERVAIFALGIVLFATGLLAAMAEPVVYDALTYRLPRIGHWLQEGRIGHFATNDPRQNYMPIVPDVMMAWFVAGSPTGWRPVALVQWFGGLMLLGATIGLARQHGLGRRAAIGAALLCAGMANVAPQFASAHTDLVTAGLVATAFFLWRETIRVGRGFIVVGIAVGLALGAKGTVFYFVPTLLFWAARDWPRSQSAARTWALTAGATLGSILIFAAPTWWANLRNYGGPFGPPEFVTMHHQGGGARLPEKTFLNLTSSLAQNFEPHSQPPGLRAVTGKLGRMLAGGLPEQDDFSFEKLNRRETLLTVLKRNTPDADATAVGLVPLALFILGMIAAAVRRTEPAARSIIATGAGVLGFLVFFHAMQQWHPYGFRYFVLAAPWIAIVAAFGLASLSRIWRITGWGLALGGAGLVGWHTLTASHQVGWQAVTQPARSRGYFVAESWSRWLQSFDHGGKPLYLALPFNLPRAAFYRQGLNLDVNEVVEADLIGVTAEQALKGLGNSWLIVSATRFLGNEGRVMGKVWLYNGEPGDAFSLAAYRLLEAPESAAPLVYRHVTTFEGDALRHELLVRPGEDGTVTLRFTAGHPCGFSVNFPSGTRRGEWSGGEHEMMLPLAENQVSEVIVRLTSPGFSLARDRPQVSLKP